MVGRGVLLDIARFRGVKWMQDGESISNDELDQCAEAAERIHRHAAISSSSAPGKWTAASPRKNGAAMPGAMHPDVKFENCYWCQEKQLAAICTDTWGVEVRPNETTEANQPWHWVVIPAMGLCMGEIFYLKELAEDCETGR